MSLTSFLTNKSNQDVRDKFKQEFPKPKLSVKCEILASPLTKNYGTVGTAFDYLLRFYLEYLNPGSITRPWIAFGSHFELRETLQELESGTKWKDMPIWIKHNVFNLLKRRGLLTNLPLKREGLIKLIGDYYNKADTILSEAKRSHSIFLQTGKINDELIRTTLLLAQLDPILRANIIDLNIGIIDDKDIEDLRGLISIVNSNMFQAKRICLLNPNFEYSYLVGGADSDLVVDDILIDIKTTKTLELSRSNFNQLIGYYALYKMGGIEGMPPKSYIKHLGIYFSRYGYLYLINVQDIIDETKFSNFLEWFKQRATKQHILNVHPCGG